MNQQRIEELKEAFNNENISWGELAEIQSEAKRLGIEPTDEMGDWDTLTLIEAQIK